MEYGKKSLKPHRVEQWVIPPKANSAFVAGMATYRRPRDPDRPLVCLEARLTSQPPMHASSSGASTVNLIESGDQSRYLTLLRAFAATWN
jgi:hypothetical protein